MTRKPGPAPTPRPRRSGFTPTPPPNTRAAPSLGRAHPRRIEALYGATPLTEVRVTAAAKAPSRGKPNRSDPDTTRIEAHHRAAPSLGRAHPRRIKALYGATPPTEVRVTAAAKAPSRRKPNRSDSDTTRIEAHHRAAPSLGRAHPRRIGAFYGATPPTEVRVTAAAKAPSRRKPNRSDPDTTRIEAHHRAAPSLGRAHQRRIEALYGATPPAAVRATEVAKRPPGGREGAARRRKRLDSGPSAAPFLT
jgi:hypothetical protein